MPNATETEAGKVEKGTLAEGRTGADQGGSGPLYVPPSVLHALLRETRGHFLVGDGPTIFPSGTVPATGWVSSDLRGTGGIPSDARGVVVMVDALTQSANRLLYADSADAPNAAANSPRMRALNNNPQSSPLHVPFGTGANAGKIRLSGSTDVTSVTVWCTGWWR